MDAGRRRNRGRKRDGGQPDRSAGAAPTVQAGRQPRRAGTVARAQAEQRRWDHGEARSRGDAAGRGRTGRRRRRQRSARRASLLLRPPPARLQLCAVRGAGGPRADLPARRHRLRPRPPGRQRARRDQRDRDRLRHQPQRLLGRRGRLDAVHAGNLGRLRGRRQRRRGRRSVQPRRRDLRRGQLPARRRSADRLVQRRLRLQPRRLVRRRSARQRAVLRPAGRRRRLGRLRTDAEADGAELRRGEAVAQADPGRLPQRLRERRRPLRPRPAGRLGAGRGRPAGVELRPRHVEGANFSATARSAWSAASGRRTRSTATATVASATATRPIRRPPWRG